MCIAFGNVLGSTGTDMVVDMYVENTTRYPNWVRRACACPARASASEARTA